jgi:plastocyanin
MSGAYLKAIALALSFVSSALGANTVVQVGKDGLTFTPPTISASPGDTVTYNFNPKNHSVVQSSFADP